MNSQKKSDSCDPLSLWTFPIYWVYFLVHNRDFWLAVIGCSSVFMLEDTTEACLSSRKMRMRAFTEVIAFLFVPSTFTFSLFHCPFSLHISCFFLFQAFYVFIAPFFIISVSHHFIVSFLTFTFLITPPFLSSCVPFSDFKQCQASVVWVNREVSLSLSLCAMVKCHTRAGIESPVGMKWALHQCDKRWSCFCVKKRWFMC